MKLGAVLLALVACVACANAMRLTYDANFFGGADEELAPSSALSVSGLRGLSPNFVEENADMGARCGQQNGGASCDSLGAEYEGACCSKWGFCGRGKVHCAQEFGCQSNCESGDSPLLIEEQEKPKKKTKTVIKDVVKKVKSTKTQKKEIQVVIPGAPPEVPIPDVPPPTKVVPALEKEPFERMLRIIHSACPVCKKRPKPQPTTLEEISKEASEASGDDTPEEESSEETSEEASEEEEDDDEEKEPEPSVPEEAKIAKPTKEEKKIAKDLGLEPKKKGCKTTDLAAKRKELAAEYLAKLHHYEQHQKELAEEIRKASNNDALRAELQALTQQVGSLKAQAEKGWSSFTSGKSSSAPSEDKKAEDKKTEDKKTEDKKEDADSESSKKGNMEATGSAVKLNAAAIANAQEENKRQQGRKTYSLSDNPEAVNNERDQQLHRS